MPRIFEITPDEITRLTDIQLTELLLHLEAKKYGVNTSCITASLNIKAPDAREDSTIKWEGKLERTNWFPKQYTLGEALTVQGFYRI